MYVTTNTFNNEIDTPILANDIENTYLQIFEKRFELGLTDGQGFTFMQKDAVDDIWYPRTAWAASITSNEANHGNSQIGNTAKEFAESKVYYSQRRAWNTQESAQTYVDFINQLGSPAWSATYDGFDESIQNDGSSLLG
jgi:1,2-phenylacetyl-CoA epoxidase PaaB subunit